MLVFCREQRLSFELILSARFTNNSYFGLKDNGRVSVKLIASDLFAFSRNFRYLLIFRSNIFTDVCIILQIMCLICMENSTVLFYRLSVYNAVFTKIEKIIYLIALKINTTLLYSPVEDPCNCL